MIGIGVVGCGHWGPNHIRNFQAADRSRVLAFVEVDERMRARAAKLFPDIEALSDLDALLAIDEIDAVIIATPTSSHFELVRRCLEHGKDVLCEKPLARTSAEASELVVLAEDQGRILMVGHTFLYNNGIQALKGYLDRGEIGTPQYIHLRRTNLGPIRQDVNVVYDLASHDVYIANYLLGGIPERVVASGGSYIQEGIEDVAFATLHYPQGVLAHIHVSWLDPKKEREITIVGDQRMIVWDDLSAETIKIYDKTVELEQQNYDSFGDFQLILKEGNVVIPKLDLREPLANEAGHFLDCVANRAMPVSSGSQGLEVVRVLEDIQSSLQSNRLD